MEGWVRCDVPTPTPDWSSRRELAVDHVRARDDLRGRVCDHRGRHVSRACRVRRRSLHPLGRGGCVVKNWDPEDWVIAGVAVLFPILGVALALSAILDRGCA